MSGLALVVLDVAGTTVEDGGQVPRAFRAALAEHGLAVDDAGLVGWRGASKRGAIRGLAARRPDPSADAEAIYASFRRRLAEAYASDGVRAVEGAEAAFDWLHERAVCVALTTGFDRETTGLLLAALGWGEDLVDVVVCSDEVPRGRPAPDLIHRAMERSGVTRVERVAAVGDTVRDLEAARHAGVRWNVGVLSGAHDRATLAAAPHTHLVDSVAALPALFAGL